MENTTIRPAPFVALVFGKVVEALRTQRQISQNELARRAAITPSGLSRIERGENAPNLSTFLAIADGLGIPPSDLMRVYEAGERGASLEIGRTSPALVPPGYVLDTKGAVGGLVAAGAVFAALGPAGALARLAISAAVATGVIAALSGLLQKPPTPHKDNSDPSPRRRPTSG